MDRNNDRKAYFPQILIALLLSVSSVFAASVYLNDFQIIAGGAGLYSSGTSIFLNESYTDTLYYPLLLNPNNYYNSSTLPDGLNMSQVVAGIGNWSADKIDYLLIIDQRYNDTQGYVDYIAAINLTNGTNGVDGVNGMNGQSTNVTVTNNGNGTYLWVFFYANGTNYANFTTSNLTGSQGIQGIQGIQGVAGINGTNGVNGTSFSVSTGYLYDNGSNVIFFNETKLNSTIDSRDNDSVYNFTNGTGLLLSGTIFSISNVYLNSNYLNVSDQRYNDSVSQLFENGTGISSIQAKGIKGDGQMRLVNGSSTITGIGTTFLGGGLKNLEAYAYFYIGSKKYFAWPVSSNTSATLTATLFGGAINWTYANLTTDFYLLINNASGDESRALGMSSTASGLASLAAGSKTVASGSYSFAAGDTTIANATGAVALGVSTVASGYNSFASGFSTTASGNTAFAAGQNTVADGLYGVAMGYGSHAGSYSFAFGRETNAEAVGAVSMGYKTNVTSYADLVIGRYNVGGGTFNSWVATDPVFEIGNGASTSSLSNALTIYKNGNQSINGNMSINGSVFLNGVLLTMSSNVADGSLNTTKLNSTNSPIVNDFVSVGTNGQFTYTRGEFIESINITTTQLSTTSNTVWTDGTNLTLYLNNASTYLVKCEIVQDAASVYTGVVLRVNTTGTPSYVRTTYTKMSTASAMETFTGTSTSSNSFSATGSSSTASIAQLNSLVVTSSGDSVQTVELRSEVSGSSVHIETGSYCMAVRVS